MKDFYVDNSGGVFTPHFDVVGPVPLTNKASYYGANSGGSDVRPGQALKDACDKLDAELDFSQYATNGTIQQLLFIYAGFNEAENTSHTDLIWPHEWYLSSQSVGAQTYDGVTVNCYSCTSELQGTYGTTGSLCGIGTACHEFGHALGLPDFYDTGDDTNGALYCYSTMCAGSYNNDSHTPPYFNALERNILGWMDSPSTMPTSGTVTIPSIATNFAYKTNSDVSDEYFIYECRPGTGWDAPLQAGMIVYHVDKSSTHTNVYSSYSAKTIWNTNYINAGSGHPCFYIIPAADQSNLYYSYATYDTQSKVGYLPFPGKSKTTTYTPVAWSGSEMDYHLTGIAYNSSSETVTLNISSSSCLLTGKVKTIKNAAIADATVEVYAVSSSNVAKAATKMSVRPLAAGSVLASATTDENGLYTLDLQNLGASTFDVVVSADGYVSKTTTVTVGSGTNTQDFTLLSETPVEDDYLYKYDASNDLYLVNGGSTILGSVGFTAEELQENIGRRIDALSFIYYTPIVEEVYVLVDFGDERVLWYKVDDPQSGTYMTIDLRGENIFIPEGKDAHFGYALIGADNGCLVFEKGDPQDGGMYYSFDTTTPSWTEYSGNIIVDVTLSPSAPFNYIVDPGEGVYSVGSTFSCALVTASNYREPESVAWYYDDEPVDGETISLTEAGEHTVTAELTLQNSAKKVIELEITVQ